MTRPIRIRSTNAFSAVSVRVEPLPSGLFTPYFLEQDLISCLRYLDASGPKQQKLLIACWFGTLDGSCFVKTYFLKMRNEAGLKDWTVARFAYPETPMVDGDTLR